MSRTTTTPATPSARRALAPTERPPARRPTQVGIAPCANAPTVGVSRTGYYTVRGRGAERVREAVRVDVVRRAVVGK